MPQKASDAKLEAADAATQARMAREALGRRRLREAMLHVSAALADEPLERSHLALLDRIAAKAKAPLLLVEDEDAVYFGVLAVRARLLASKGRYDEAMDALFRVVAFRPAIPYLLWAEPWLGRRAARRTIAPSTVAAGLVRLAAAEPSHAWDAGGPNAETATRIARLWRHHHPDDVELAVATSRWFRACGCGEEGWRALEALAEALEGRASWAVEIERAAHHRERGAPACAIEALERAATARPDEPSTWLDLGDARLGTGELERAAASYQRAGDGPWARIGLWYVGALRDEGGLEQPLPDAEGEAAVWGRLLAADASAYETRLPDPVDPTVAVLRRLAVDPSHDPGPRLRVRVRCDRPASPSACLAARLLFARHGRSGALIPAPAPEPGPLWTATEAGPTPRPPAPPPAAREAVETLVRLAFDRRRWTEQAPRLAEGLEPSALSAAMVHAPPLPPGADPVRWVFDRQVAAALLMARCDAAPDERWQELRRLLTDPFDWTAAAAAIGAGALAQIAPALVPDVIAALDALLPPPHTPLGPSAQAVAVAGCRLTAALPRFVALRVRLARERFEETTTRDARGDRTDSPFSDGRT